MKRKQFNPFPEVGSAYGSPMGRKGGPEDVKPDFHRTAAKHQGGRDGYDRGGAYWGNPRNVWAVWNHGRGPETVRYVRANTAEGAKAIAWSLALDTARASGGVKEA